MAGDPYEGLLSGTLAHLSWKLETKQHISADELANTLVQSRGNVIPDQVLDYLVAMLRGETKKPSGRPPKGAMAIVREAVARSYYEEHLAWLQKRQAGEGLKGWSCIREADWWEGPPHERAAKMTVRSFRRAKWSISENYVRNLVSSFKRSES